MKILDRSNLIELDPEQRLRLHELNKTLRETGLNAHLAYQGALILLQDENLGIASRTPSQQQTMSTITLILGTIPLPISI